MSPYSIPYPIQHPIPSEITGPYRTHPTNGRHDDSTASHSGSEDGSSYNHYHDPQKNDTDPEEDPNLGLTSQTLNADGTPKRPMNAFMIFARRRRPQVSAENQSMRTGEISKILSREWNTMDMAEKQFYLDQAKQLKENFNSKYPDYVYRRRPNNSRRRRRMDGGIGRTLDNPLPNESADDISGSDTFGEHSPVEGEDALLDNGLEIQYSRMAHDTPPPYNDHGQYVSPQSRTSNYTYSNTEIPYRSMEPQESRISYLPTHERVAQETPPTLTNGSAHYPSSYMPAQSHSQPPLPYSPEPSAVQGNWDTKGENGRPVSASWIGNHDRPLPQSSASRTLPFPTSSSSPNHTSWQTSNSASVNSSSPVTSHIPNYPFPTLNSPFYPNPSQMHGKYSGSPSSSAPHSESSSHYNSPNLQMQNGPPPPSRHTAQYEQHSYSTSPSINASNGYMPSSSVRDTHLYQARHTTASRPLPPLQTHAAFPSHPVHTTPPSSIGFWARDNIDG